MNALFDQYDRLPNTIWALGIYAACMTFMAVIGAVIFAVVGA